MTSSLKQLFKLIVFKKIFPKRIKNFNKNVFILTIKKYNNKKSKFSYQIDDIYIK